MKNNDCKICSITPDYPDGMCELNYYENSIELTQGGWTCVRAGKDDKGKVMIYGLGDDYTELYYPNYCPECGRKLHD